MNNTGRQQNQFDALSPNRDVAKPQLRNGGENFQKKNPPQMPSSSTKRFTTQSAQKLGTANFRLVCLLEGTVIEVHETYGFLLAEPSAGSSVHNLTDNASGRFRFKFSSQLNKTERFEINDSVTFSLKVFEPQPGRPDGDIKYEVFDIALRYLRTDEDIYGFTFDHQWDKLAKDFSKKDSEAAKPKIEAAGMIVSCVISKNFCFVKPLTKLPGGIFKPDNFYLHFSNLAALNIPLVYGDTLQIVVNPNQAEKMRADRGILTSLSHKGHSDVNKVVRETLMFLREANSDEKFLASQLYETKPILALYRYFLTFTRLPHSKCMNVLFTIFKVLSFSLARFSPPFIHDVLELATDCGLFDKNGLLWKLLSSATPVLSLSDDISIEACSSSSGISSFNLNEVFRILLNCVELYPNCSRKIHNLIAIQVDLCTPDILLAFMRVLSKPYTKREDMTHRELKLVPTDEELQQFILNEESHLNISNLSPVLQWGPYESAERYIETYFNLLRFDCFYNFLVGLKSYMKGKHDSRDTNVYRKGTLLGIGLNGQSAALTFTISSTLESNRKLTEKDDIAKYFLFGNLVAVFPNEASLTEPIWTTVNGKDPVLPDGSLTVNLTFSKDANDKTFIECLQKLVQNSGSFLLIESPTYYQSYWPVLKALQKLEPKELPFLEELVMGKTAQIESSTSKPASPRNTRNEVFSWDDNQDAGSTPYCRSPDIKPLVKSSSCSLTSSMFEEQLERTLTKSSNSTREVLRDIELDCSQNEALTHLLERRLAIVQGPPGTGKTFLGVQAVKVLLDKQAEPINGPILIVTYKNHSLDEFSKQILNHLLSPNHHGSSAFVRVGGQSKDEEMRKYSLRNLSGGKSRLERSLCENLAHISDSFLADCEVFEKKSKLLEMGALKRNLSVSQIANLISSFVNNNHQLQKSLSYLKTIFKNITNMADVLYKLLDIREFRTGIIDLEIFFNDALHDWLPNDGAISNFVSVELRKQAIEQQKLFLKSTQSVTVNESTKDSETETGGPETEEVDAEDLGKVAETRAELSRDGPSDCHSSQQHLTFATDEAAENPTKNFCRRHYGSLTKFFASKVDIVDFKLIPNLYDLSLLERFQFLQAMLVKQCEFASSKLNSSFDQFEGVALQARKVSSSSEVEVLRSAKVVAMTITGAAIRNDLLNTVEPSVIVVEEAAEISEAHLMALLGSHVKHLILIGDHKQLRPQVECFNLVKKYHFDISMMERMINNKLPFATLANQNRMRPDISKYLKDIYPELKDSIRVLNNPEVTGLQKNFFFWNHEHAENKGRSPVNPVEAEAALALAKYLVEINGYSWSQITVICGYKGQTALLRRMAKDLTKGNERLDVQTIDMFQGDENDIVIVSTTRCNPERRPGFMSILNRRCVAQSRGKSGIYFLGNAETLCNSNRRLNESVWSPLLTALWNDGCFGDHLVVECKNHKDVTKALRVGDKFPERDNLLCGQKCPIQKQCGIHTCQEPCQPYHDHFPSKCNEMVAFDYKCGKHSTEKKCYIHPDLMMCTNECDFKFHTEEDSTIDVHNCTKTCEPEHSHDKCYTKVSFSCEANGHPLERYCWENPKTVICHAKVSFVFKFCGIHKGERKCYENELTMKCRNRCLKLMDPCDHPCDKLCEPSHDHDSVSMPCKYPIKYSCTECGGPKVRLCYQKNSDIRCEIELAFLYPKCGRHEGFRKCYEKAENKTCLKKCELPLPNCSHPCEKACAEDHSHDPTLNKCKKIIKFQHRCQKSLNRYCWQSQESIVCDGPCVANLKCQHRCPLSCDPSHAHEENPEISCREIVQERCANCGSDMFRKCSEKLDSSKCSAEVKFKHSCGFEMLKPCNKPGEQVDCTGQCTDVLPCGHRCIEKCGSKHNHSYRCNEAVEFNCKCCTKKLTRKCYENEVDIKCIGEMMHMCLKCNFESRGPCQKSNLDFRCFLPCSQKLDCGHICSQKCFEICSVASCQTCISAEKEKERIETEKRQAQKRREIEDKKAEICNELQNTRHNHGRREVFEYEVNPKGEDSSPYFEVRDMTLKFLKVQKGYMVNISSVSLISNLWAKRRQTENQLLVVDPTNKKTLCYFTTESEAKIQNYVQRGFHDKFQNRPRDRANKNPICFPTTSAEVCFKSENFYFTVLVCDVVIGRAKTVSSRRNAKIYDTFDSVFYANNSESKSSEYLIFNPFNVVVTYVVKFTLEPIKSFTNALDIDEDLRNGKFQKIRLESSRNLMMDDRKQYYYRLAESQYLRWCRGNDNESMESVDLFFNPELEAKFEKKKAELTTRNGSCKEILAFHGTPIPDPEVIMQENFKLDKIERTLYGYGIYFSEFPSESLNYSRGTGQLILARVLLGKGEVWSKCETMSRHGEIECTQHDSHSVNPREDGYANMVIIQNVDQILPMFIIRTVST